jgi:hypothetical protein
MTKLVDSFLNFCKKNNIDCDWGRSDISKSHYLYFSKNLEIRGNYDYEFRISDHERISDYNGKNGGENCYDFDLDVSWSQICKKMCDLLNIKYPGFVTKFVNKKAEKEREELAKAQARKGFYEADKIWRKKKVEHIKPILLKEFSRNSLVELVTYCDSVNALKRGKKLKEINKRFSVGVLGDHSLILVAAKSLVAGS